ncbi:MAG: hypothetical protein IPN96_17685 [Anaerolineales bacterium]|nr:hypothetical protein [Anaerolineales bacterium]
MTVTAKLLGYNYTLSGEVIHGAGADADRLPTANVDCLRAKLTPSIGIYAC